MPLRTKMIVVIVILLLGGVMLFLFRKTVRIPSRTTYSQKLLSLQKSARAGALVKNNSNHMYGLKFFDHLPKLNFDEFTEILSIEDGLVELECNVTIQKLLQYLYDNHLTLLVIPDMAHLTIGGIVAGIGGGSASFRHGFFHEQILDCEVLLRNGDVVRCSRQERPDLFYALPNSLGTIGYITKMRMKTVPLPGKYVRTRNLLFQTPRDFFDAIQHYQQLITCDFLDGTIFGPDSLVLVVGQYENNPAVVDNVVNDKIYWKSLIEDEEQCFEFLDYVYRFDTDLYYTSKDIPGTFGKILRSRSFRRLVPKSAVSTVKKLVPKLGIFDTNIGDIVQDVMIPFSRMREFFAWFQDNVGLYPLYVVPAESHEEFAFWPKTKLCDFGIGYGVEIDDAKSKTKSIEEKMLELGGRKLLYTQSPMTQENFWPIYDPGNVYSKIREKYSASGPNVWEKIAS